MTVYTILKHRMEVCYDLKLPLLLPSGLKLGHYYFDHYLFVVFFCVL